MQFCNKLWFIYTSVGCTEIDNLEIIIKNFYKP